MKLAVIDLDQPSEPAVILPDLDRSQPAIVSGVEFAALREYYEARQSFIDDILMQMSAIIQALNELPASEDRDTALMVIKKANSVLTR